MKSRLIITAVFILLATAGIAAIFWNPELKYTRPTPVPAGYQAIAPGEGVQVAQILKLEVRKPVLLHFFNPECPCSRFNLKHLKELVSTYGAEVAFVTVVPEGLADQTEKILEELGLNIPVVADKDKELARRCGVYSTPRQH